MTRRVFAANEFRAWLNGQRKAAVPALKVSQPPSGQPSGQWSVMLVNHDQSNDHAVRIAFDTGKPQRHFTGQVDRISFGSNEYQWHQQGVRGHGDPDGPPSRSTVSGGADLLYEIPKASITILRGHVGQ